MGPSSAHIIFKIWKFYVRLRHKIFIWLLLYDRINTRNLLNRKSLFLESYNCALCTDNTEETLMHLFWDCPFSLYCWDHIMPQKPRGTSSYDEICISLQHLPGDIGLTILIASCWGIWSIRNERFSEMQCPPTGLDILHQRMSHCCYD